jgi:hypothetical protein
MQALANKYFDTSQISKLVFDTNDWLKD